MLKRTKIIKMKSKAQLRRNLSIIQPKSNNKMNKKKVKTLKMINIKKIKKKTIRKINKIKNSMKKSVKKLNLILKISC